MGKGTLKAGKCNLILSVRHLADQNRLNQWKRSFEQASKLLYNATEGQHSFGKIHVCNNYTGGDLADAYLLKYDAVSSPGTMFPGDTGLGKSGYKQILGADERFKPYVIIHEFGHYAYGLGEEYDSFGAPQCTSNENTHACIMEFDFLKGDRFGPNGDGGVNGWAPLEPGIVTEFCYPGNHTGGNQQESTHHESCWETMAGEYPELLPIPGSQPGTTPGAPDPIVWVLLQQEQRFSLVLDKSGSMGSHNKLSEAQLGANYWINSWEEKDKIGVVSFADTGDEVYPLTEITDQTNLDPIESAIDSITAEGNTSIGGGLRKGLNQILGSSLDVQAASQAIVLVTDGYHNTGEDPEDVLDDLIDNRVRVYVIGIGPSIKTDLLHKIADDTGGEFRPITLPIDPNEKTPAEQIRDALIEFQAIAHENGEVVVIIPGSTNPGVQEKVVRIEDECRMATFTLSWRNANDLLHLELLSPDPEQEPYKLDSYPKNARPIYSEGRPYMGFQVMNPVPGQWTLRVNPERVEEISYYRLFVFSQNTRLHGSLVSPRKVCNPGDPITLHFLGHFDRPITGLDVTGTATIPGGKTIPLVFNDETPADGVYTATFTQTRRRGMYSFNVAVKGDKNRASYARPHWPNESYEGDRIPSFDREYSRTVAVAEQPYQHVSIEPEKGHPGE
jgi:hypothetical protein